MDVYERETVYNYRPDGLYRDTSRRVFTGVCAGIGRHFNVKANWIRLGFIIGFLVAPPLPLIVYVVATFIMPRDHGTMKTSRWRKWRKGRGRGHGCDGDYEASGPFRATARRKVSIEDVIAKFDDIDRKVCSMEDVVTSKEFTLRQKFRNLKD